MVVLGAVGNVETFSCYTWIDLVNPSLLFRFFDLFFVFRGVSFNKRIGGTEECSSKVCNNEMFSIVKK